MTSHVPEADIDVTAELVRRLLDRQAPAISDGDVVLVANGWDNAIFRLVAPDGTRRSVRLPRRAVAADLIRNEQRWLGELADVIEDEVPELSVPRPLVIGQPSEEYPYPWMVMSWMPGETATDHPPADAVAAGTVLGKLSGALHRSSAPPDAPTNRFRGVGLAARAPMLATGLQACVHLLRSGWGIAREDVERTWSELETTPVWAGSPRWLHGDLHPSNLLTENGSIVAVIDFGDLCQGDPASDLAVAWMLFGADRPGRDAMRSAAGWIDDDTWRRGRGWAIALGLAIAANSSDRPAFQSLALAAVAAAVIGDD